MYNLLSCVYVYVCTFLLTFNYELKLQPPLPKVNLSTLIIIYLPHQNLIMIIKLGIIANSFTVCLSWISDVPERGVDTFHPWLDTEGNCIGRCGLLPTLVPLTADWGPCESLRLCCDDPRDWSVRSGIETIHAHMVNHMAIMVQNLHIIITKTPIFTSTCTLKTYKFDIVFSQAVKHFAFLKRIYIYIFFFSHWINIIPGTWTFIFSTYIHHSLYL